MSFYKMERGWLDSPMFGEAPYDERSAWAWMIAEARWEAGKVPVLGSPVMVDRGQFSHSIRFMAQKFQWTKAKVEHFLGKLKKWENIKTDNRTGQLVITICNYSKYQDRQDSKQDTEREGYRTAAGQQQDKQEEIQEIQEGKEKKDTPLTPTGEEMFFEYFWNIFPRQRRGNKEKAFTAYKNALKRATAREIEDGTKQYTTSSEVTRGFAKGAAAWLNDDRWRNSYSGTDPGRGERSPLDKTLDLALRNKPAGQEGREGRLAALGFSDGKGDV